MLLAGVGSAEAPAQPHTPSTQPARVLPGEFEPVERLLVAWDDNLAPFLLDLIAVAVDEVPITVLVAPGQPDDEISFGLRSLGIDPRAVQRVHAPVGSVWVRDFGPLVVRTREGGAEIVDFAYHLDDYEDTLPGVLGRKLWPQWQLRRSSLFLEGGNVLSDGQGRCVSTAGFSDEPLAELLIDDEPPFSEGDEVWVRDELRELLGCEHLVVVPPLVGEPTGHVDMFTVVTGPAQAIVGRYASAIDPVNARRLDLTAARLRDAGFRVRRIPMPDNRDGLFRSYTNALALNGSVLVPVYPEAADDERAALKVFEQAYPGRRVVPVVSSAIIELYGAVHCATMTIAQMPKASREDARLRAGAVARKGRKGTGRVQGKRPAPGKLPRAGARRCRTAGCSG
ncbi:Porphyromonas-type peptidyl-arginine deiminase [Haliangium ochraceum DSM 14365]|uniref:Porphyromonas-type peptidyl-arginine deiminase n=1 Tax=Haliangium ochraceum (strain DSM 14365 / JCM 11303 / SMP-2) TaxID=502025 RepID=D0LT85_HALO1|nr:Porphyromonas-type peptidyl-arginine deiminase [Haliangium ochraceum DSM 14365]